MKPNLIVSSDENQEYARARLFVYDNEDWCNGGTLSNMPQPRPLSLSELFKTMPAS